MTNLTIATPRLTENYAFVLSDKVFNSVDWFSHYSQSNSQPPTLKLERSFIPHQSTFIRYTNSHSICSPLPPVGFY